MIMKEPLPQPPNLADGVLPMRVSSSQTAADGSSTNKTGWIDQAKKNHGASIRGGDDLPEEKRLFRGQWVMRPSLAVPPFSYQRSRDRGWLVHWSGWRIWEAAEAGKGGEVDSSVALEELLDGGEGERSLPVEEEPIDNHVADCVWCPVGVVHKVIKEECQELEAQY
ncbi:hypothetical protein BDK51DRAFT_33826 [Blyttiomyces helicus]|uniref:Uncharacterized protein n=1 Tax=Blyttiomyces helicus TaxID=388810 RepID=A0A4P9WLS3_9FUNG|nr:hypothetical protein BDK51DRAFT_33826 [Blyttiomyces helicus]|eukprot:RKO93834.1 hypothetical protein BDK51DRAFT_33826 [Blyttiomyces helicus]